MRYAYLYIALLVVGLIHATLSTGCAAVQKGAEHAKQSIIDCASDGLDHAKPVAIAMVPELTSGDLEWKEVEGAAIAAGARFGGCLLAHLHDALPKPSGYVGVPTQAELALMNLRKATGTDAKYRTSAGTL